MAIKNLILDLGGVILNLETELTRQAFTDLGAVNIRSLYAPDHEIELFTAYEIGQISSEDFRKHLKALLFIEAISDADFDKAWNAMLLDLPAKNLHYLKQLSTQYRLFLFSNTNEIHLREVFNITQRTLGINSFNGFFEREYYSHLMGMRKPDPAAFLTILQQNQLLAEETLFIDDSAKNIAGAQSVGIQVLHLEKPRELTETNLIKFSNSPSLCEA